MSDPGTVHCSASRVPKSQDTDLSIAWVTHFFIWQLKKTVFCFLVFSDKLLLLHLSSTHQLSVGGSTFFLLS